MTRRLVIFLALAIVAVVTANSTFSGASFTTESVTFVSASTSEVSHDRLQLNAGDGQLARVGTAVAIAPSVLVTDVGDNPVSGVLIVFSVTSGGGSVVTGTFATTDASGVATVDSWTLGTIAGSNRLRATAVGLDGAPVDFTATGVAGPPTRCVVTASDYSPAAGSDVTVEAQLSDQYGNSAGSSGVSVTFTTTGGGTVTAPNTVTTDSNGRATTTVTVATIAGTRFTVTASSSSSSVSGTSPTITTVAGAPSQIALIAGNGQLVAVGAAVAIGPSVRVTDAYSNPCSGVAVAFSVASGGGSVTGDLPTTDAFGIATVGSWTLGTTAGANTLTATAGGLGGSPVTFTATGVAGAATRYVVTSTSGYAPVAGTAVTVTAQLADQYGNAVKTLGITVTWTKTGGGGPFSSGPWVTDGNGVATVTFTTTSNPAGIMYTITATGGSTRTGTSDPLTSVAGPPSHITIKAGNNNQTATVGTAVATDPSVFVTDAHYNPCPGASVAFSVTPGGGSVTDGSATTNASGIATVGSWTLGTTVGANTLTATAGGLGGSPVTFTATGVAGAATRYVVTSTSGYAPVAGTAVKINAQLADQYGNAVSTPNITVTWTKTVAGVPFSSGTSVTDNYGIAPVTFTTSNIAGIMYTITAADGSARTGTSNAITTVAGPPSQIARNAINNQSAIVGTAVETAPSVLVTDAYGNPCTGVAVTFTVTSGLGSVTGGSATTNASGIATVSSWTLGTMPGNNRLRARCTVSGTSVNFTATAVIGPATQYVVTSTSGYNPHHGTDVTINAQLADQYGNAVRTLGITVIWSKTGTGGSFSGGTSSVTDVNGVASVTFRTSNTAGIMHTITATDGSARTGTSKAITTQ